MNEHVGRGQPVRAFFSLDSENLSSLDGLFLFPCFAVIHSIGHGPDQECPGPTAGVQNDGILVHAYRLGHKVTDMVRGKRLIFIRLPDVLVESREEQVQEVLPGRILVVDMGENSVVYELKYAFEVFIRESGDILIFKDVSVENAKLLELIEVLVVGRDRAGRASRQQAG